MLKNNKSLAKNSIYYLIYNVVNVLFPLVTGIYVSRVLLDTNIGEVEAARNLAQYFVVLSFLGIPTYGLREIAQAKNDAVELNEVYSELMIINAISTASFAIIYFAVIRLIPIYHQNIELYAITGLSILLNFLNNSWLFEGLEEFKYISNRNILFKMISFVLLILLVRQQDDYYWYALITVIGVAGNYVLNIINSHRFVKFKFTGLNLKRHLKPILYLVVVNLAIEIYSLVDVTMLNILCDSTNVAYYSYGSKIYKIFLQIINTFTVVLVPRLAAHYKQKEFEQFNEVLSRTLKVIITIAVPMIAGVGFVSDYIITFLYTDTFITSSYVLKILSLILLISPIGYLLGSRILLVSGNEKKMIIPVLAGACVNIVSNLYFIRLYDEIGAAIASVLGEIVVMAIYLYLGRKHYKLIGVKNTAVKVVTATACMSIVLYFISRTQLSDMAICVFQITAGIVLYFAVLLLTKEEVSTDCLKKLVRKFRKE